MHPKTLRVYGVLPYLSYQDKKQGGDACRRYGVFTHPRDPHTAAGGIPGQGLFLQWICFHAFKESV